MKLNPNMNVPAFLRAVHTCKGEVRFITKAGDDLNLKSELSQFVFAAVIAGKLQNLDGSIEVRNSEDAQLLKDYCI